MRLLGVGTVPRLERNAWSIEVGLVHLLPGYPTGILGLTLPVEAIRSDLNTRGYLDTADSDAVGTRVSTGTMVPAVFEDPRHYSNALCLKDLFTMRARGHCRAQCPG